MHPYSNTLPHSSEGFERMNRLLAPFQSSSRDSRDAFSSSPDASGSLHASSNGRYTVDIPRSRLNPGFNPSNISPFVSHVNQFLKNDGGGGGGSGGSDPHNIWSGNPRADDNPGDGSTPASRRHSISGTQPPGSLIDKWKIQFPDPNPLFRDGRAGSSRVSNADLAADLEDLSLDDLAPLNAPGSTHACGPGASIQPSSLPTFRRAPPFLSIAPSMRLSGSPSSYTEEQSQYSAMSPDFSNVLPGRLAARPGGELSPALSSPSLKFNPQQAPYYPQQMQRRASDASTPNLNDLGKGVPLSSVPASWPLYIVEFKAGRTDLFYLTDLTLDIKVGDLVIVEADRGKDLGKVVNDTITLKEVEAFEREQKQRVAHADGGPLSPGGAQGATKKEINPKMIYGKAQPYDIQYGLSYHDDPLLTNEYRQLRTKQGDEAQALSLCRTKVQQKKLPMEVVDAEYQWCVHPAPSPGPSPLTGGSRDRKKLTFYFIAEKRIDFRELVRELFRCVEAALCPSRARRSSHSGCTKHGSGWPRFRAPGVSNRDFCAW